MYIDIQNMQEYEHRIIHNELSGSDTLHCINTLSFPFLPLESETTFQAFYLSALPQQLRVSHFLHEAKHSKGM